MPERVVVADDFGGARADAGLAGLMGISRSQAATLIAEGNVLSRGKKLGKSARLVAGDVLEVTVPERRDPLEVVEEVVEGLKILLDDDDFVVVDKPVGVAAHPSPGWVGPTVVGGLAGAGYRISTSGAPERVGIVHRLDVGTSGAMVVAKTERAYTALKRAFKERTVDKVYHAVVQGLPDPLEGTIDAPIGRHPGHDWRFAVIEDGRPSGGALR
jgi:23S rRNA pseudouridine1911/1915/1917 synthase